MANPQTNGKYRTSDFQEAIYLYKSGIIYLTTEWTNPQRATFVFKIPPDAILSAWQRGDDGGVRATLDAAEFLRKELRGRDR